MLNEILCLLKHGCGCDVLQKVEFVLNLLNIIVNTANDPPCYPSHHHCITCTSALFPLTFCPIFNASQIIKVNDCCGQKREPSNCFNSGVSPSRHKTSNQCWLTSPVYDAGPTINQHCFNALCLLGIVLL